MEITKESIVQDFRNIGVQQGDCIFVTANLMKTGFLSGTKSQTMKDWKEIFHEVFGEEGTMIVAAYTKTFFRLKKDKSIIFSRDTISTSGALSNLLVKDSKMIRSTHPVQSCIGFGKHATEILGAHTENSLSYAVFGSIIKLDGKFLHLGTVDYDNCPHGYHYAQEYLGTTKWNPYVYLFQSYYEKEGEIKLHTKKDVGGCSRGAKNFYGELMAGNAVKYGYIGRAFSAIMPARKSFEIIKDIYKVNKAIARCNDKDCVECYGNLRYNGISAVAVYCRILIQKMKSWVVK